MPFIWCQKCALGRQKASEKRPLFETALYHYQLREYRKPRYKTVINPGSYSAISSNSGLSLILPISTAQLPPSYYSGKQEILFIAIIVVNHRSLQSIGIRISTLIVETKL